MLRTGGFDRWHGCLPAKVAVFVILRKATVRGEAVDSDWQITTQTRENLISGKPRSVREVGEHFRPQNFGELDLFSPVWTQELAVSP